LRELRTDVARARFRWDSRRDAEARRRGEEPEVRTRNQKTQRILFLQRQKPLGQYRIDALFISHTSHPNAVN
jgi:hypothetical protein